MSYQLEYYDNCAGFERLLGDSMWIPLSLLSFDTLSEASTCIWQHADPYDQHSWRIVDTTSGEIWDYDRLSPLHGSYSARRYNPVKTNWMKEGF